MIRQRINHLLVLLPLLCYVVLTLAPMALAQETVDTSNSPGASISTQEISSIYKRAIVDGNSAAKHTIGDLYYFGLGVPQDYAEAFEWYRQSAREGYLSEALKLGNSYYRGEGVEQNYKKALRWYRKAAEQWDVSGQLNLALMYSRGAGVQRDYPEALKWFRKAAEFGNASGQVSLGRMYSSGLGTPQDFKTAVKWFRKAAEQGDPDGQFSLGMSYSKGHGVIRSGVIATNWLFKAGISYLGADKKDLALSVVQQIKSLADDQHFILPNTFLADTLLAKINDESPVANSLQSKNEEIVEMLSGTGWPVAGGYVVTNYHVVEGLGKITLLRTDGVQIKAVVAAVDKTNDLVLLRPQRIELLPAALPLAVSPIRVGEQVFTVGYPHPDMMGTEPKITKGIVNARNGFKNDTRTFQISVPLQSGNSGGPLLNMRGEVVGVVTSKMSAVTIFKWTGDLPQNVNYAVKGKYLSYLLSSVEPIASIEVLPAMEADLATLSERLENSVMMVLCQL